MSKSQEFTDEQLAVAQAIRSKMTDEELKEYLQTHELPALRLTAKEQALAKGGAGTLLPKIIRCFEVCPFCGVPGCTQCKAGQPLKQ